MMKHKNTIGYCPNYLSWFERVVWISLRDQCTRGFLQPTDRVAFALLVKLATPLYQRKPLTKGETRNLTQLASKFGFTPFDTGLILDRDKQRRLMKRNEKEG